MNNRMKTVCTEHVGLRAIIQREEPDRIVFTLNGRRFDIKSTFKVYMPDGFKKPPENTHMSLYDRGGLERMEAWYEEAVKLEDRVWNQIDSDYKDNVVIPFFGASEALAGALNKFMDVQLKTLTDLKKLDSKLDSKLKEA
jgi:hypothetical protein